MWLPDINQSIGNIFVKLDLLRKDCFAESFIKGQGIAKKKPPIARQLKA